MSNTQFITSRPKIAVITAECGGGSIARDPSVVDENTDYFLFTDAPKKSYKVWKRCPLIPFSDDNRYADRRNAKVYKVLSSFILPGYDYYIWHDASHDMQVTPQVLIELCEVDDVHPWGVFRHSARKSILDEARVIISKGLDYTSVVRQQLKQYKREGYPESAGLYELPVVVRKAGPLSKQIELMWWDQICRYSSRDQLSLPYVLWKLGVIPKILPGKAMNNKWVTRKWENQFHQKCCIISLQRRIYNWFRYKGRAFVRLGSNKY